MEQKLIVLTEEAFKELNSKLDAILCKTNPISQGEQWLTNEDVLKRLDISKSTLQTYRDKLIVPFYQVGRKILYKQSEIDAYMEKFKITSKNYGNEKAKI